MPSLTVKQIGTTNWWVVGFDSGPVGPYRNEADARRSMKMMLKSLRDEPGYVTSEDPRLKGER